MATVKYALDERRDETAGGTTYRLRLRGADEKNPVLLFLHGGPGVCDRHWVLHYQSGLADVCTMVCWDQRGAGLAYDKNDKTPLTVGLMIEDAHAVTQILKRRFGKEKIFVVGHSWGSVLGALLVQKYPEDYAAYIGMGQFVEGAENETLTYQFVVDEAEKRGDKKAREALRRIGAPAQGRYRSRADMMVQRDYLTRFGGGVWKGRDTLMRSMVLPLLRTPEYHLGDLKKYADGAYASLDQLWDEVVSLDFFRSIPSLAVPVHLFQGDHDMNTPTVLARRWFDALSAPSKDWVAFHESAHSPIKEEPEKWGKEMRRVISGTR